MVSVGIDQTFPKKKARTRDANEYDLNTIPDLIELIRSVSDSDDLQEPIANHLRKISKDFGVEKYKLLLLYDELDELTTYHSDTIYEAASPGDDQDILIVVSSPGGKIEPAYLISKSCKKLAENRYLVAVPRRAKSAATLLCLGADEIHMGLMSELGPIDPQIRGYPALSLSKSLNVLAELSDKYPGSSVLFSRFLSEKLELNDLGYFDRVSESAAQYAERLLQGKQFARGWSASTIADYLVYHYKDHGFVIDVEECESMLGRSIVKQSTPEYQAANAIYLFLSKFAFLLRIMRKEEFDYVGSVDKGLSIRPQRNKKTD